jgi:acetyltransferase-like isoleucine patch superfamily enzyme
MTLRALLISLISLPVVVPYALYRLRLLEFVTVSRSLALIPGRAGMLWRRRWYEFTLAGCGPNLYVDWMAAIRTPKARLGRNVFIGTFCWLGWVDVGDEVMLGGHITVLSGAHHHHFNRLDAPMTQQGGELSQTTIGRDVWVGDGAVIMADVAPGTVIGAGAVVTRTFAPNSILAGVPARVMRQRGAAEPPA